MMRTVGPLLAHVAEEANRFRLGDLVEIDSTRTAPWVADWQGVSAEVVGVVVQDREKINIWLRHDGDQITDDFRPEDLRLVSRPSRPSASEAER